METRKLKGQAEIGDMLPILATAALENAAGGDDRIKALLVELIEDQLDKRRKEKEKAKRLAESAVQAAKEEKEIRENQQKHCNHRKQDGSTRLAGQWLTGTAGTVRQLSLVCQFCNKNFFHPALPGQEEPPRELFPPPDEIGG